MPSVTSTRLGERTRKEADTLRENKIKGFNMKQQHNNKKMLCFRVELQSAALSNDNEHDPLPT